MRILKVAFAVAFSIVLVVGAWQAARAAGDLARRGWQRQADLENRILAEAIERALVP